MIAGLPPRSPLPPPELRARVLAAAARMPTRRRGNVARFVVGGVGAAVFLGGLAAAWLGDASGAAAAPLPAFWLPAVTAGLVTTAAIARRRGMFGPPLGQLAAAILVAPLLLATSALAASAHGATDVANAHPGAHGHLGLVVSTAALLALLALAPPRAPTRASWSGAAVGAAAGAWFALACNLSCPNLGAAHVLVHHVAAAPMLAALGALVAWWLDHRTFARRLPPR